MSKLSDFFYAFKGRFGSDPKDTEELYRDKIEKINYANTIETALPQTQIHKIIMEHFNNPLAEGKTSKKAILIGYDGTRADVLYRQHGAFSAVRKLRKESDIFLSYAGGVNYPEKNTQETSTAPGWCSIITGELADKTLVTDNGIPKSMDCKSLLVSLVEEKLASSSAFFTKWSGHFLDDGATYGPEKEYCEKNRLNVKFYCKKGWADVGTLWGTLRDLSQKNCSDFIFTIYEETDRTGHRYGFSGNNPLYKIAFAFNDFYAYITVKTIERRKNYDKEDWLIVLSSDHGGFKRSHGGATLQERMTFIISSNSRR